MARLARILVTALLLWFILSRVHPAELWQSLRSANVQLIVLGYLLNLCMVLLNAWRWQILVRARGTDVGIGRLTGYYFVCMFFNTFTPTSVGGDVVRVIDLARHTGRRATALASILVERVIGLYVLLPVSLFGLAASYSRLPRDKGLFLYLELVLVVVLAAAFLFLRRGAAQRLLHRLPIVGRIAARPGPRRRIENVQAALDGYRGEGATLWAVFAISVASRVVWILSCCAFGAALNIGAPLAAYFLVIPLVEVARTVPISLAGIGIREGALVILFGSFGVESAAALGLSILIYAPFLGNGLLGGVLYALRGKREKVAVTEHAG